MVDNGDYCPRIRLMCGAFTDDHGTVQYIAQAPWDAYDRFEAFLNPAWDYRDSGEYPATDLIWRT